MLQARRKLPPPLQLTGGAAHVIFVPGANAKQQRKK